MEDQAQFEHEIPPDRHPMGKLRKYHEDLDNVADGEHRRVLQDILKRMAKVDSDITKSEYGTGPDNGSEDRPPTGDDYNDLWNAVLKAINESIETICESPELGREWFEKARRVDPAADAVRAGVPRQAARPIMLSVFTPTGAVDGHSLDHEIVALTDWLGENELSGEDIESFFGTLGDGGGPWITGSGPDLQAVKLYAPGDDEKKCFNDVFAFQPHHYGLR